MLENDNLSIFNARLVRITPLGCQARNIRSSPRIHSAPSNATVLAYLFLTSSEPIHTIHSGWGIKCELLTAAQCAERAPLIDTSDIIGGLWIPDDGVGDPQRLCETLVAEARARGVHVVEHCPVTRLVQRDGRVAAVEARHGAARTECEFFVNCGGFWARQIGQLSQPPVKVPLHAVEHYQLHTAAVPGLAEAEESGSMMPVVRDLDGRIYMRELDGCLLAGGFELEARPAFGDGGGECDPYNSQSH